MNQAELCISNFMEGTHYSVGVPCTVLSAVAMVVITALAFAVLVAIVFGANRLFKRIPDALVNLILLASRREK